jgi:hypothetical protein
MQADRPRIPPGPPGKPLVGNLFDMGRKDPLAFWQDQHRRHGDAVRLKLGPINAYLFVHPDAVHEVLVSQAAGPYRAIPQRYSTPQNKLSIRSPKDRQPREQSTSARKWRS